MHVLRFFLKRSSAETRECAPARCCIRVLTLSKQPSLRFCDFLASGSVDHPSSTFTVLCRSPISQADIRLAFKSHSTASTANVGGFLIVSL
jgi:hypothetical protein